MQSPGSRRTGELFLNVTGVLPGSGDVRSSVEPFIQLCSCSFNSTLNYLRILYPSMVPIRITHTSTQRKMHPHGGSPAICFLLEESLVSFQGIPGFSSTQSEKYYNVNNLYNLKRLKRGTLNRVSKLPILGFRAAHSLYSAFGPVEILFSVRSDILLTFLFQSI